MNFCEDAPALACQNYYLALFNLVQYSALFLAIAVLVVVLLIGILRR